ncbi:hypothetical protein C8Q78DRAFT_248061 [Trametes maxima]|nr:hypothetical protein C8Q78DRAFT_248061 [Trametes maxima]
MPIVQVMTYSFICRLVSMITARYLHLLYCCQRILRLRLAARRSLAKRTPNIVYRPLPARNSHTHTLSLSPACQLEHFDVDRRCLENQRVSQSTGRTFLQTAGARLGGRIRTLVRPRGGLIGTAGHHALLATATATADARVRVPRRTELKFSSCGALYTHPVMRLYVHGLLRSPRSRIAAPARAYRVYCQLNLGDVARIVV